MGTLTRQSPLERLRERLDAGLETPTSVAREYLARVNSSASRNTYLWLDSDRLMDEAAELDHRLAATGPGSALYGVPVSLKDCFDLRGTVTTAGTRFYAERTEAADHDSAVAARLRESGALIMGKTHMHGLAYGITGENPDFGDCLQPRDAGLLTGGSSSGAAASVQEGSAVVAIGTDTGGSVRVPAALCGLVGYRASHRLARQPGPWPSSPGGLWAGGVHLAATFDTVGLFVRDPRDAAVAANALFGGGIEQPSGQVRIGCVAGTFLHDCDPEVSEALALWRECMLRSGYDVEEFEPAGWEEAQAIFSGIQAHEAAQIHRGRFDEFEPAIANRLRWGEGLPESVVAGLRERMADFSAGMLELFRSFDLLMLPAAPVRRLVAGEDQTGARGRILKYTTPFSLAGLPAVSLPGEMLGGPLGSGVQIGAAPGADARLLGLCSTLGERLAREPA
ncbi:MAG: amidase [Acidobacteriota bacterium]|nr:amidase [Acidobacteriota bacterium]